MTLADIFTIHLLLSPAKSIEELQAELQRGIAGQQTLQGAEIRIAPQMEARLTGQNFEITLITPEVQAISGEAETEWKWDVQPKKEGSQELHLTVSAILYVNKSATHRVIQTFDKKIEVQVTWGRRISGFFVANWQWLWTAILIPACVWAWRMWKRKRAQKTSER